MMAWLRKTARRGFEVFVRFPFFIMGSPFKGFDQMKYEKRGSYAFAFTMLALASLLGVLEFVYTGFLNNYNNPYQINSLYLTLVTLFPVLLFVSGNWSVTTLMDGKGRFGEIFMAMMYAMYPMCLLRIVSLLLSNVLTMDEIVLGTTVTIIGAVLFAMYLFVGQLVVHEYSFSKGLGAMVLTLVAMMIIVFVLMLLFSLVADVVDFITIFVKELILKFF